MLRLYRFDISFEFIPGDRLYIADTLSRASVEASDIQPRIMQIDCLSQIPDQRVQEIRNATENDFCLQTVLEFLKHGWPKHKTEIPLEARHYWELRDTLSYDEGIILKGEAVLIPKKLRSDMKKRVHSSHLGYDSMMRRIRGVIFWAGINHELKEMSAQCEACQEIKPRNQKEPLKQHNEGQYPFEKIGTDLFEIKGQNYLVTVDYYSNFIEVDKLTSTTSVQVIQKLKKIFARFGVVKQLVSDPGPQFTAKEFKDFVRLWGIEHIMSAPGYHRENGKA